MALTLTTVRERVETSLSDAALQRIISAVEAEIERHHGSATSESETVLASGTRLLALSRRHASVTSIVERRGFESDPVTLSSNDWREVGDYQLLRLTSGTNPSLSWGHQVVVTYAPEVELSLRERVALDLIQMDVEFRALDREKVGDWEGEQRDYKSRRAALLAQVREGAAMVYA
jgi:hypothetical protein